MEALFRSAVELVKENSRSSLFENLTNEEKLRLYALYKQGTEGPCTGQPRPGFFDLSGQYKQDAWLSLGQMSLSHAQIAYIETVMDLLNSKDGSITDDNDAKMARFKKEYHECKRGSKSMRTSSGPAGAKPSSSMTQTTRSTGSLVSVTLGDKAQQPSGRLGSFSCSTDQRGQNDSENENGHTTCDDGEGYRDLSESGDEEEEELSRQPILDSEMDLYDSENMDESEDSGVEEDPLHVKEPFDVESSSSPLSVLSSNPNLSSLPIATHPLAASCSTDHQATAHPGSTFSPLSVEQQLKLAMARIETLEKKLNASLAHSSCLPPKSRSPSSLWNQKMRTLLTIFNVSYCMMSGKQCKARTRREELFYFYDLFDV